MNHTINALFGRAAPLLLLTALPSCAPDVDLPAASRSTASRLRRFQQIEPESRDWFVYSVAPTHEVAADRFGFAVAVSGDTAVISAPGAAAAYVFVLADHGWQQQAKLEPPDGGAKRSFGASVAIMGDTVVVGATPSEFPPTVPGVAYLYARSGTTWGAPTTLAAEDEAPEGAFGCSVAILDDAVFVGAHHAATGVAGFGSEGAVYVFNGSGLQTRKLFAQNGHGGNLFGAAVAASRDTLLVGSPGAPEGNFQGTAYVFVRSGMDWDDGRELALPEALNAQLGGSVAIAGDLAVVGAPSHVGPGFGFQQGAAFVYTRSGSNWNLSADRLLADDGADLDAFGTSVALFEDRLMVSAPGSADADNPDAANSIYLFAPLTSSLVEGRIGNRGDIQYFGGSVDWDGDVAVVGSLNGSNGAYTAEFRSINGSACDEHLDCGSRYCVDGVCCESDCSGACESCTTGICTPLPQGTETPECGPYLCGETGGHCPASCVAGSQCSDTHFCRDGECVLRLTNGEPCTRSRDCKSGFCIDDECAGTFENGEACASGFECKTGHCVDGVCCDLQCHGQCEACDVRGALGTCKPVQGAPHGDRPSCEGGGTVCGGQCNEHNSAACTYPASSESCGASCADGVTTESVCNGQGACEVRAPQSCGRYVCNANQTGCRVDCDSSQDCAEGFTCADAQCEPGATCRDASTVEAGDGTLEPCGLYRCDEGRCLRRCESKTDCADDSVCDLNHECVPAPPRTTAGDDDGGCTTAPQRRPSPGAWIIWMLVLAAGGLRRRSLAQRPGSPARRAGGLSESDCAGRAYAICPSGKPNDRPLPIEYTVIRGRASSP